MASIDQDNAGRSSSLARWFDRGFWALVDQALFAGSNFFVNVALARWLSPDDYGAFAAAYAVFLLLGVFHTALLSEPLLVYGPGKHRQRLRGYWGLLLRGHARFALFAGTVLALTGGVALLCRQWPLGSAMLTLAVVQSVLFLPWMLRDACYVVSNPRASAMGGMWYFAAVAIGLTVLWEYSLLGIGTALMTMGVGALLACASIVRSLRIPLWHVEDKPEGVAADHWRYGRWAIATGLTHYVPQNLPLIVVPIILHDYAPGGALKALLNLTVPFVLAGWAFSNLIVPVLVVRRNTPAFGKIAVRVGAGLLLLAVVVWTPLAFFGRQVMDLVYDGHFSQHAPLLWVIGLIPLLTGPAIVMSAALRALERPERVFYGTLASSIVLVALGVPLLVEFGLLGMVIGMAASHIALLVVMWWTSRAVFAASVRPVEPPTMTAAGADAELTPMQLPALSDRPLVTVLMGNYNYGQFIGDAIDSVLTQTYDHFELIVCDDGSTDQSVSIVESYVQRDPRVRLIAKPNGGQASALNEAYRHSRGQIVCLLDSDDRYAPSKLERLVEHYRGDATTGMSVHALHVIGTDSQVIQRIPFLTAFEGGWIAQRVVHRGGRWRYMPSSALSMRRELADRLFPMPEPSLRVSADSFLFTLGPLLTCVNFIDEALADYRLHVANSFSSVRIDARACCRNRDAIRLQIVEANRWLQAQGMATRLDYQSNVNFREHAYLAASLADEPGGSWRDGMGLLGRILVDDLYGPHQKMLALPTYGLLMLMPRSWRAGWLTFTMSYGSHKRWLNTRHRTTRPGDAASAAPARVMATAMTASQEALS